MHADGERGALMRWDRPLLDESRHLHTECSQGFHRMLGKKLAHSTQNTSAHFPIFFFLSPDILYHHGLCVLTSFAVKTKTNFLHIDVICSTKNGCRTTTSGSRMKDCKYMLYCVCVLWNYVYFYVSYVCMCVAYLYIKGTWISVNRSNIYVNLSGINSMSVIARILQTYDEMYTLTSRTPDNCCLFSQSWHGRLHCLCFMQLLHKPQKCMSVVLAGSRAAFWTYIWSQSKHLNFSELWDCATFQQKNNVRRKFY